MCGLSFENYNGLLQRAAQAEEEALRLFTETIKHKMEVFLNPAIQERLKQGAAESNIAALLNCATVEEVRKYLVEKSQTDPGIVEMINRYLKEIVVKKVRIADFKPTINIVEKDQIVVITREFQAFLEQQLESALEGESANKLPMLQVE